jgi:hypothetical protein
LISFTSSITSPLQQKPNRSLPKITVNGRNRFQIVFPLLHGSVGTSVSKSPTGDTSPDEGSRMNGRALSTKILNLARKKVFLGGPGLDLSLCPFAEGCREW